jgi:ABC-type transport system involved in multi-copper enzyme maturation permease subunit
VMFFQALATEFTKLRRSKVTWGTFAGLSMGPLGIALLMWILREPGRAAQLGLLGAKANLSGLEATWTAYAAAITLIVGVGGMLLLSFIVAYVFGREYTDGTAKNLLALPVGRHSFVLAKLVVAAVWWFALAVAVVAESLVVGLALALPGFSAALVAGIVRNALLAAAISYLLVPVIAWITTAGRGYMPPLAFALVMMGLGNLFGKTGWAEWFPWSIVPSLIGMVGQPAQAVPAASYVALTLTFVLGVAATVLQLRYADNSQ